MNYFTQLLINYWQPIVGLLFTIIGFIIALIKKKPVNHIMSVIYAACIQAINTVEDCNFSNLKGVDKLNKAISIVYQNLKLNYPTINAHDYYGFIVDTIEKILSTPHKKG